MIWFTSDTHFGHKNIIKYCERPFKSIEHMNFIMTLNWNNLVKPKDTVWHLGDFCLGSPKMAREYFSKLNGRINILANRFHHDSSWLPSSNNNTKFRTNTGLVRFFEPISVIDINLFNGDKYPKSIVMCHYPIQVWDRKHYKSWHLYGHIHNTGFTVENGVLSMNVGVDSNNYCPVSLEHIIRKFSVLEKTL